MNKLRMFVTKERIVKSLEKVRTGVLPVQLVVCDDLLSCMHGTESPSMLPWH